jgi:hypothetical protein
MAGAGGGGAGVPAARMGGLYTLADVAAANLRLPDLVCILSAATEAELNAR